VIENRRSRRKPARQGMEVTNALTGKPAGFVGNLSVDGMLLIAHEHVPDNSLFQFAFDLPAPGGAPASRLEIGVHEQWSEPASTPGQFWSGFRIIDIAPEHRAALTAWLNRFDEAGS